MKKSLTDKLRKKLAHKDLCRVYRMDGNCTCGQKAIHESLLSIVTAVELLDYGSCFPDDVERLDTAMVVLRELNE